MSVNSLKFLLSNNYYFNILNYSFEKKIYKRIISNEYKKDILNIYERIIKDYINLLK